MPRMGTQFYFRLLVLFCPDEKKEASTSFLWLKNIEKYNLVCLFIQVMVTLVKKSSKNDDIIHGSLAPCL